MLDNQYDTILDALKAARDKGFTNRFVLEGGMLRSLDTNESFVPANIRIEAFHRVEGSSDPDDNAILYLLETNTGARGTLTDAFGTYANSEISALIQKLEIDRSETIMPGASEKKCLNCGAVLRGKYCSECGQKDEHQ